MKKLVLAIFCVAALICTKSNAQSAPETKSTFSIADSASFKGKYKFEGLPFEYIQVSVQDAKLYFVGGEYNGFLVPISNQKDAFNVNDQAVFTFNRNTENKITELKVDYQGQTFLGKKEEPKN